MLLVGLTGAIGSGKTVVADLLARRGAVVIDADELARMAVEPGSPGLVKLVDEFGAGVLDEKGRLDRAALAARVFHDEDARRRLEAIVHPEVARLFAETVLPFRGTGAIVVYVVPLLVENRLQPIFDLVVTVSAPQDVRVARLAADRSMTADEARARMAAQATDSEREAAADLVVRNDGGRDELDPRVEETWAELERRAAIIGAS